MRERSELVHRQVVDNTVREREKKNYTQTYIERMGAQNEEREKKKKIKEKERPSIKEKNKYSTNNGTLFFDIQL